MSIGNEEHEQDQDQEREEQEQTDSPQDEFRAVKEARHSVKRLKSNFGRPTVST
jgi:hypothetical protein